MSIPDDITLFPISGSSTSHTAQPLLVYFITGNPGLIGYYTDFLHAVQTQLSSDGSDRDIIFYGASLDGFELNYPPDPKLNLPLSLPQQVERVALRLERKVQKLASSSGQSGTSMPVVLIGHSVGSYILLEVIARWQRSRQHLHELYHPVAGICLFPTVTEIAQSEKGRQLSWLLNLPYLPTFAHALSRIFQYLPRGQYLDWARPLNPGPLCVDVTAAMVRSAHGVRQLLYMANDEMKLITTDRWLDELWGVTSSSSSSYTSDEKTRTQLYFYWGVQDYWVDNVIRDALILKRGHRADSIEETRCWPRMEIAKDKEIPHTFSLDPKHTKIVADAVAGYLREVRVRVFA